MLRLTRVRVAPAALPSYRASFAAFRAVAEQNGWRAWLFRGREEAIWLECLEGKGPVESRLEPAGEELRTVTADLARWREPVEETWWDEPPETADTEPADGEET